MVIEVWECDEGHETEYPIKHGSPYEIGAEENVYCPKCEQDRIQELIEFR